MTTSDNREMRKVVSQRSLLRRRKFLRQSALPPKVQGIVGDQSGTAPQEFSSSFCESPAKVGLKRRTKRPPNAMKNSEEIFNRRRFDQKFQIIGLN
jgi:hypothetical protein